MLNLPILRGPVSVDEVARRNAKKRTDCVFVHVNKTAGSSVSAALGIDRVHLTAREWIKILGRNEWERRFTFGFVRDPWSKVASHYRYRMKTNRNGLGDNPISFNDWVRRAYGERDPRLLDNPLMFEAQAVWLSDDDGLAVDFVGRFENLADDFAHVAERLGVEARLPRLRQTASDPTKDARDLYEPDTYEIVAERFKQDLDLFGYEP